MRGKAFQESARCFVVVGIDAQPCIDKGSDEPGPDGALVVGRIAGPQVAVVLRFEIRVAGDEASQSDRCQQMVLHHIEYAFPSSGFQHRMRQRK